MSPEVVKDADSTKPGSGYPNNSSEGPTLGNLKFSSTLASQTGDVRSSFHGGVAGGASRQINKSYTRKPVNKIPMIYTSPSAEGSERVYGYSPVNTNDVYNSAIGNMKGSTSGGVKP